MIEFLRGRRILVVEDEFLLADDLQSALERAGAEVLGPSSSVRQALAILRAEGDPDGAVLDVNLAGDRVWPVALALRERGVPFVFATGYDAPSIDPEFSAVPRLVKPVEAEDIVARLFGPEEPPGDGGRRS